jgi:hypothetical protein
VSEGSTLDLRIIAKAIQPNYIGFPPEPGQLTFRIVPVRLLHCLERGNPIDLPLN